MKQENKYIAIDLFSGVGGLSAGIKQAGFDIRASIEIDKNAVAGYKLNHKRTKVFDIDIRDIEAKKIKVELNEHPLHLLAGCPPCQGFSSVRRLNRKQSIRDSRNSLILEYLRFVKETKPLTIMMENVPGLRNYYLFKQMIKELSQLGYNLNVDVVNVKNYGVPQSRNRLVLLGSKLGKIDIAPPTKEKVTVRQCIGSLEKSEKSLDWLHKVKINHTKRIKTMISLIPKDGGSRKDLPDKYILNCHKKKNVGFSDIYGRLRWDDYSSTITGGCLNPSKGRFLHPEANRVITPREAALLQTFPPNYKFPKNISKESLGLLIGNALPPKFSFIQSRHIKKHLGHHLG